MQTRHIAYDQACRINMAGLDVFEIDAVIANVRISQRDQLLCVRGIGKNLLIAGHCGIEYHFADCAAFRTNG